MVRGFRLGIAPLALVVAAPLMLTTASYEAPAQAQANAPDPAMVALGFRVFKEKISCNQCHGWSGNGVPDDPRQPVGASLRATKFSLDDIAIAIKCGLPDTEMPYFDARSYEDDRCYGKTAEQMGDSKPSFGGTGLIPREIQAVVAYLQAKVLGRGPFTRPECEDFFGAGSNVCNNFTYGAGPQPAPPGGAVPRPAAAGDTPH